MTEKASCVSDIGTAAHAEVAGHVARSRYLDAFAQVEAIFLEKSKCASVTIANGAPFGQRAKLLSDASDAFRHPTKVQNLCALAMKAADLRATLIHSEMAVARHRDGTVFLVFRNAANPTKIITLTADDLKRETTALKTLAKQLSDQLAKPAPNASAAIAKAA